jgi:hypothetical protein
MENFVVRNLRKGLMAASLSAALCFGGAMIASAQSTTPQPDPSQPTVNPQATSPSQAPTSPSTAAPATAPDQDNGVRPAPNPDSQSQQPMSEQPAQAQTPDQGSMSQSASQVSADDVKAFDDFLDSHKDIAEDLQKDPQKVNDSSYVSSHEDLAKFLQDNPKIREELKSNPSAFISKENQYEKHEDMPQSPQSPQSPQK